MTKQLHKICIYYDVMVVADTTDFPINIAMDNLPTIIENEKPEYQYIHSIGSIDKENPWYSAIPYGDADGKPCCYYTEDAIKERQNVVKKVQGLLTKEEWDALTTELCEELK